MGGQKPEHTRGRVLKETAEYIDMIDDEDGRHVIVVKKGANPQLVRIECKVDAINRMLKIILSQMAAAAAQDSDG